EDYEAGDQVARKIPRNCLQFPWVYSKGIGVSSMFIVLSRSNSRSSRQVSEHKVRRSS
ncbi:hypothetical protein E4U38_004107, partial [Claviceps purpurea]